MSGALIFFNGSVYSPADPFATAALCQQDKIAWVGSDAGASSLHDSTSHSVDLQGLLMTPAFVAGGIYINSQSQGESFISQLKAEGYTAACLFCPADQASALESLFEASGISPYIYLDASNLPAVLPNCAHGVYLNPVQTEAAQVAEALDRAVGLGLRVSLYAGSPQALTASLALAAHYRQETDYRQGFRLEAVSYLSDHDLEQAVSTASLVGFSRAAAGSDTIVRASRAGLAFYLGSDIYSDESAACFGWKLAQSFVLAARDEWRVSARSVFNAMTRGVYRALGSQPDYGQLLPGAVADFSLWQVDQLMVQVPDSRLLAWSTDPRARIPLLPALDTENLPRLCGLYRAGSPINGLDS